MPATADISKLSLEEVVGKLAEIKDRCTHLSELTSRSPEEDIEFDEKLEEFDLLNAALPAKKDDARKRRLENVKSFDKPKDRRAGAGNGGGQSEFGGLGERLQAVARSVNGFLDPRLRNSLGANESTPSDGGFLVGEDYENDLMSKAYGNDILNLIPRTPIGANSNSLHLRQLKENSRADGSRDGGVLFYWGGEGGTITPSQQAFEKLVLNLEDLFALTYITSQLLEDAPALQAETSQAFRRGMGFSILEAVINGDGINKPSGIMSSPAKITVSAEAGQTASDPLYYENIVKMYARLHPGSQGTAIWMVDQTLIPYLMTLHISVGTGGQPVYQPPNGAAAAPFGTILGRPVFFTEHTQAANTEGDIILWDPQSYRIIDKGSVNEASSMHVAFLTNEMAFRWVARINGASKWRSPLTPKNGGATLSTIITLATRT
jgi:HK97 family phage major capsid protein